MPLPNTCTYLNISIQLVIHLKPQVLAVCTILQVCGPLLFQQSCKHILSDKEKCCKHIEHTWEATTRLSSGVNRTRMASYKLCTLVFDFSLITCRMSSSTFKSIKDSFTTSLPADPAATTLNPASSKSELSEPPFKISMTILGPSLCLNFSVLPMSIYKKV